MIIDNLFTELILYKVSSNYSVTYRSVVTQWNDTTIIADECQITEYSLIGV